MKRSEVTELYYIAPIENVPSILRHGILSHNRAVRVDHGSVAMEEIQARRQNKQIPGARTLHDYANLYFDAHNPMLSRVRDRNDAICVLRVSAEVLDLPGVIVADRNAASGWVNFSPVAVGLAALDSTRVFARYWTHPDNYFEEMSHKSEKCAEVLVPDRVEPRLILGAYVANATALANFQALNIGLTAQVKSDTFF